MTAIRVELELDDGSFTTRMLRAGQSIETFERQAGGGVRSINALQTSSQSFIGTLRDVTVVLGQASAAIGFVRSVTTGWASEIIKVNAEFERLRVLLSGMSKAADPMKEANQQLREMREFAKTTPYSLQAITGVFTQMKSAGIEPTIKSVKGLTDAVASFGGSEEVLKRAALAMSQMSGKGVIQMEELRQQLGEAVPRATELMARSMGVTVPQLVKAISTGTVEAKRGLELLNAEMERTFGGAAAQQMDTWNGLMSQLTTGFQTLAANTGDAGFFEAAKKGARELIALMDSPAIKGLYDKNGNLLQNGLSQNVGEGLTKVVGVIDGVIRKVIEFRSEIVAAGEVFVYAFGAAKAFQALNGMASFFNTAATQIGVLRRELAAAGEAMTLAGIAFQGAGTRAEGFRQVAGGAMLATRAIAVAAVELVPVLAVVGAAVMAAASYFDLFGEKAAKAREDVKKFGGAASDEAFANFKSQIDAQSKALDALIAKRDRLNGSNPAGNGNRRGAGDVVFGSQINEAQKKLAEDNQAYNDAMVVREADAAERAAQIRIRALDLSTAQQRRALDQQGRNDAKAQEEKLALAAKEKRSTEQLAADYAKQEKARQLAVLDVQINADQKAFDNALELSKTLTGEKLKNEQAFIDQLGRKLAEEKKAREAAAATPIGVPLTAKQVDEQKLLDKGQKALENIQAQTVGLRAGLAGASVEVYELQQRLADGKFGPVDSGKVQELINQLLVAQAEKSKLDELFDGKQKFDKDLASLKLKAEQDLFEAQTRNLSEYDKFVLKVKSGAYQGIGPASSPAERAMIAQRIATVAAGDAAVEAANRIKQSLGEQAVGSVDTLTKSTERLRDTMKGVAEAAGNVSLPQVAGAITGAGSAGALRSGASGSSTDVTAKDLSAAARVFLNAISGPESAGRYNVRYTPNGGATFDSYDQHPNVRERTKDGRVSTAAGRYQFTKSTWDEYGGGNFSPENQDRKAWQLAQDRYRANTGDDLEKELRTNGFSEKIVQALQGTWEALTTGKGAQKSRDIWQSQWDKMGDSNNVQANSTYRPMRKEDPQQVIPSVGLSEEQARKLDETRKLMQQRNTQDLDNALSDEVKKLTADWKEASAVADGYGKRVSSLRKDIEAGKLGDDKNPDADRYKAAMKAAEDLDAAEKERAKNQKDRSRISSNEEARAREAEEINLRAAALKRQQKNDTNVDLPDSYYRKAAENERVLEAARRLQANGDKDFTADKVEAIAAAQKESLSRLKDQEVLEMQQAELKKTQAVERENLTADQARQRAYDDEVKRQRALVALTEEGSDARATAEANAARRIAAERQKLNQSSPLAKQAKEWSALGENMEKAMTGWLDSGVDAIAEFVTTGKADFASLFQSIAKDITKMGLKYLLSQAFGGANGGGLKSMLGGAGGAGKGAAGGAGKASGGGAAKMFGAMHTGGIVGAGFSMSRTVNPAIFGSAPRFHTGGIIGADEVPIIAQRGEGVFTREQMKAMGGASGSNVITLAPQVTVNAAGGTPEQNNDLAKQTAQQMHESLRGLVQRELAQQLRPGNMLNQN